MEQESPKVKQKSKKKTSTNWMMTVGISLILTAVVLMVWFFLRGETKVTGGWPEPETTRSISCVAENLPYSFYEFDNAPSSSTQVNVIFGSGEKIKSISLLRKMYYDNPEQAKIWSDAHEFDVNRDFGLSGLKAYALNANFSVNGSTAQMALYATSGDLDYISNKYFLLEGLPNDIDGYVENYEKQGFICEVAKDE